MARKRYSEEQINVVKDRQINLQGQMPRSSFALATRRTAKTRAAVCRSIGSGLGEIGVTILSLIAN
jgi:hypothetical protein